MDEIYVYIISFLMGLFLKHILDRICNPDVLYERMNNSENSGSVNNVLKSLAENNNKTVSERVNIIVNDMLKNRKYNETIPVKDTDFIMEMACPNTGDSTTRVRSPSTRTPSENENIINAAMSGDVDALMVALAKTANKRTPSENENIINAAMSGDVDSLMKALALAESANTRPSSENKNIRDAAMSGDVDALMVALAESSNTQTPSNNNISESLRRPGDRNVLSPTDTETLLGVMSHYGDAAFSRENGEMYIATAEGGQTIPVDPGTGSINVESLMDVLARLRPDLSGPAQIPGPQPPPRRPQPPPPRPPPPLYPSQPPRLDPSPQRRLDPSPQRRLDPSQPRPIPIPNSTRQP
jgi:hypothetical protein